VLQDALNTVREQIQRKRLAVDLSLDEGTPWVMGDAVRLQQVFWNVLKNATINKLFFLSGGIEPGDEEKLKEFGKEEIARRIFGIDINSKFEISPGVKDINKVKEFVEKLRL